MVVEVWAALIFSSGGVSAVATTTTDLRRPSGPRFCSMKWRTSRPRSPTRAMTFASASEPRAISPSRVLLPTPLPEKMPTLWPLPRVRAASMARMPVQNGSVMGARRSGCSGGLSIGALWGQRMCGPTSMGLPRPSSTRPSRPSPNPTVRSVGLESTLSPACTPLSLSRGIRMVVRSRNPMTSARVPRPDRGLRGTMWHSWPTPTGGPFASTTEPVTRVIWPS